MKILLFLSALLCAAVVRAEPTIVTTVVSWGYATNSVGGLDWLAVTNSIDIPNGQAARVSALRGGGVTFEKSGLVWDAANGEVIQGPARFKVGAYGNTSLLTLERWTVRKSK